MPTDTMKAIRVPRFGGPDTLSYDEVPVPEVAAGEVLVRVHAVGINPPDWYVREGMPEVPEDMRPPLTLPVILGTDISGVVTAVAPDVHDFEPGDEVFGMLRFPGLDGGAYAEYASAPASDIALKPGTIDHVSAAGAPMSLQTAWQFLIELGHDHPSPFQEAQHRPVPLGPGSRVLINGAAGGVGHFALQLATWKGASVIAVASGRHERFLRDLGAEEVVDYTTTAAEDVVHDVDLVLDTIGGSGSKRLLRTLKRGGSLFPVFVADHDPEEVARLGITVSGTQVRSNGPQLAEIARLLDGGDVHTAIDSTFPLAEARAAHERAAHGHIQGKIVLTVTR